MALTPKFTEADIKRRFERTLAEIERQQVEMMQELGEMCVTRAREIPPEVGFQDQTGNLRSSIGCMVFVNGVAVHDNYVKYPPKQAVEGAIYNGLDKGKALAEKVGTKYKNGVCLVVTAGMNYAIYVESKGRDVLTSAELLAKQEMPKLAAEIVENLKIVTSE